MERVDNFVPGIHTVVDNGRNKDPVARDTLKIMARYDGTERQRQQREIEQQKEG